MLAPGRSHLLVFALAIAGSAAHADPLAPESTQKLMAQAPWHIQTGGLTNYFLWNDDGSLCVSMHDPAAASCDDEGSWSRNGSEICYKLTWWGSAYGQDAACFTVERAAEGPVDFHAKEANGMTLLYFSVPGAQ
ncbi:hypothetical protein H0I76_12220 [Limibaculum sp. M0105]|uniref:DUF995 domain-containing protein n=1 Tax=Thermohalobaculum xanthum TaxID=2753746 RepID=A0A8J7SEP2_9RHOB|nr:hypothetical protein [Thermohalobaculum xanthum]MBK0399958.1 hypothetical protein [Thermohalobaculum xanthum]